MRIIGPDSLVFGVEDVEGALQYLEDYGLQKVESGAHGGTYEALDGTSVVVRAWGDPSLPATVSRAPNIRETVYGVADAATLAAIGAELSRDRVVTEAADGSLHSADDTGFGIGFQVTARRTLTEPALPQNVPGMPGGRSVNQIAADHGTVIVPRTLSHVVYFVPDVPKAEAFYVERLGFRVTDRFSNVGPFLRPQGTDDHHTLFLIQAPPFLTGLNHFTFHVGNPSELMQAGTRLVNKGYQSFWGPGRHIFGSNWFWYFNSPFGGSIEYDADMDRHDDSWVPRSAPANADTSQIFLFNAREPWFPSGGPPEH